MATSLKHIPFNLNPIIPHEIRFRFARWCTDSFFLSSSEAQSKMSKVCLGKLRKGVALRGASRDQPPNVHHARKKPNPFEKCYNSQIGSWNPKDRGENKQIYELPPPS